MSGAVSSDFGFREGYAQMGSYKIPTGLAFIFVLEGDFQTPASGTLNAWIQTPSPWVPIVMVQAYEPVFVGRYPTRAAVRGGEKCAFPNVEAAALVAAGIAAYA